MKTKITLFLFLTAAVFSAQTVPEREFSAKIGIGHIKSNSPFVTSLSFGLSYKTDFSFLPVPLKFEYQLHKKIEYFFPGKYYEQTYPYLQTFSVNFVISQQLSGDWFIDFDLGLVTIHDRVFDNSDTFSHGVNADIAVGYRNGKWAYFGGLNYGLGVTQHAPTYSNYYLQLKYGF